MKYTLRPPQKNVLDKIRENVRNGKKRILVMACTGFGKTILSYEIARNALEKGNRVLFTCHRITLAEQSAEKFSDLNPSYLQGSNRAENSGLLVATLQTLLNTPEIENPDVILMDEVHYGYDSKLIQSVFERFPDAIYIGLSATPVDDKGYLLDGFDAIIDDYQTIDLINLGWLTPLRVFCPTTIETSNLRLNSAKTEFNQDDLENEVNKFDINKSIVDNYLKLGERRKFICFCASEKHCQDLSKVFNDSGVKVAVISSKTTEKQRAEIFDLYDKNQIAGLLSIEILTAGFDDPTVSCVILATVTKQWKKFIQCVGRGIRLLGNSIDESIAKGKPDCILLDCAGNIEEHGMPTDRKRLIFGTRISRVIDREMKFDSDIRERTKEISEERQVYLKKIGSILDLYDGKIYRKESELQEDANKFLEKTGFFWWRQNSGKALMNGNWVHFASKSGLPDNTAFYDYTSFYFGIELKLPSGTLTTHQKKTIPEMTQKGVLVFIAESVFDIFKAIEHLENNVYKHDFGITVLNSVYNLPPRQIELRKRLKLPIYDTHRTKHST